MDEVKFEQDLVRAYCCGISIRILRILSCVTSAKAGILSSGASGRNWACACGHRPNRSQH
jgi:hypothetical protein